MSDSRAWPASVRAFGKLLLALLALCTLTCAAEQDVLTYHNDCPLLVFSGGGISEFRELGSHETKLSSSESPRP
jgi:hypothetical protein